MTSREFDMPKAISNNRSPTPKRSRLVMEMMAIPGRSGEEAAIMDFIRGKLADGRRRRHRAARWTMPIAARRWAARSAIWC